MRTLILILLITFYTYYTYAQTKTQVSSVDLEKFYGTWNGTIQRKHKDSITYNTSYVKMIIHKIEHEKDLIEFTQIVGKAPNKPDTSLRQMTCESVKDTLFLEVNDKGVDTTKQACVSYWGLAYKKENGITYLSYEQPSETGQCYDVKVLMQKESNIHEYVIKQKANNNNAITNPIAKTDMKTERETATPSTLNQQVDTINKADDPNFKASTTASLKPGVYVQEIKEWTIPQKFTLTLNRIDPATFKFIYVGEGGLCDIKFTGILRKNASNNYKYTSDDKKTNIFLISTDGKNLKVTIIKAEEDECAYSPSDGLYRYYGPAVDLVNLRGGSTPEDLGKLLLLALKTNNKVLWMRCVHPEQYSSFNAKRFSQFRTWLEEDGVSDWNLVKFSRVTYTKDGPMGNYDGGVSGGEQFRRSFKIEFDYKNGEFIGGLGLMTIATYNKGHKYFIWFPGKDTMLMRKPRKV